MMGQPSGVGAPLTLTTGVNSIFEGFLLDPEPEFEESMWSGVQMWLLSSLDLLREYLRPDLRASYCRAQRPLDLVSCLASALALGTAQG